MRKPLTIAEYLVFVLPCWLAPVMSFIGFFWIAGNKSEWPKAPFAVIFFIFTLGGLIALTRVFICRLRGNPAVGGFEAFLLLRVWLRAQCRPATCIGTRFPVPAIRWSGIDTSTRLRSCCPRRFTFTG